VNIRFNVSFLGILASKSYLCRYWHSPLGQPPVRYHRAAYFDAEIFQAAKDVSASRGALIELFNRIEPFFRRLEIYTEVRPTTAMTDMLVQIMVEVLMIVGMATEEVKSGILSESVASEITIVDLYFIQKSI